MAAGPTAESKRGAGLWVVQSAEALTVARVTFVANRAYNGGAMYMANSNGALRDVWFVGNTAALVAGGLFCDTSSPSLTSVSFVDNAARYGAGLYTNAGSAPHVNDAVFRLNRAGRDVVFAGNTAVLGGGMSLDLASPQLNRVTFVGNSASRGGGIQSYLGTRPFQELTFRRNHASRGPNIFVMRRP
jgi:hypothetical protein